MKYVQAIVAPLEADVVCEALFDAGIQQFTTTDVRDYCPGKRPAEIYKGVRYAMHYVPRVKIEVVVRSDLTDRVIALIRASSVTDKIYVLSAEPALCVRMGEGARAA